MFTRKASLSIQKDQIHSAVQNKAIGRENDVKLPGCYYERVWLVPNTVMNFNHERPRKHKPQMTQIFCHRQSARRAKTFWSMRCRTGAKLKQCRVVFLSRWRADARLSGPPDTRTRGASGRERRHTTEHPETVITAVLRNCDILEWIRIRIRLRIPVFPSVTFKTPTNFFSTLFCLLFFEGAFT